MNRMIGVAVLVGAVAGCQVDGGEKIPEIVVVSEQISGGSSYDIDLTRVDVLYQVAPGLDASRLTVTCPSLSTISFAQYVTTRILPTGVAYDPAQVRLRLANAAVPLEAISRPIDGLAADCPLICTDDSLGRESCKYSCQIP